MKGPNARVARWLDRLIRVDGPPGQRMPVRDVEAFIQERVGHGPSRTTISDLLDPTRAKNVSVDKTIVPIAMAFGESPADLERQLGIKLSEHARLMLELGRNEALREAAKALAALSPTAQEAIFREIAAAAAGRDAATPAVSGENETIASAG
ncbi:hypothetical protein [Nonomuraea sp. KM90]|uniref:hypothetical protein n=1 Tax=Nonomuraea sp. KM90 TaxID=3457428 RepID=UPI003FCDA971